MTARVLAGRVLHPIAANPWSRERRSRAGGKMFWNAEAPARPVLPGWRGGPKDVAVLPALDGSGWRNTIRQRVKHTPYLHVLSPAVAGRGLCFICISAASLHALGIP